MNKIVVINVGGGGEEEKDYHEVDRDFAIECMIYQNSSLTSVECLIIPPRKVKWLKPPQHLQVLHPPFLILIIMGVVMDEDDDQELVLLLHICLLVLDQEELKVQKGVWNETITPTPANTPIPIRCTIRTQPPVVVATGTPPHRCLLRPKIRNNNQNELCISEL